MQTQEFAERLTETISSGVRPMTTLLVGVASEVRTEVKSLWGNVDERDELIRTTALSGAVLIGVIVLVVVTGWMPLWLRLSVLFATIGILAKHLYTKIVDTSD